MVNALFFALALFLEVWMTSAHGISRGSFPRGFIFGTSSSSYQYEGAVNEDGRGQTIWDTFAHTPGKIVDGSNADVADDHYHRYPEDIKWMKYLGTDAFRLSIAWSRIYPKGTGEINQAGVDHYNKVINALLAKGITPHVTIYHWDLPLTLEESYGGWLSPKIIKDFANYAETCFRLFGDRVKHWFTINEGFSVAAGGYGFGALAPGRCSSSGCTGGNSSTEPYIVGHHLLLAHGEVVRIYRTKYQGKQKGSIGMTFVSSWYEPTSKKHADVEAAKRSFDFDIGWFFAPMVFGDYPDSMRSRVGNRLPRFTPQQSELLKGSFDFVGINHYTTLYVTATNSTSSDSGALLSESPPGQPKENITLSTLAPHGIRKLMNFIKHKYHNPLIIITENGFNDGTNKHPLDDTERVEYLRGYLQNLLEAIKLDRCNVKGYFAWSLLDDWEWNSGLSWRFGFFYVDIKHEKLKRIPKKSAHWFKHFLAH